MIERIDIAVRLLACGTTLLLLVLLLAGEVRRDLKLPLAGLLVGSIGYLLNSSSQLFNNTQTPLPLGDFLSIFTPFFTWLFALRVFEREPPRLAVWGAAGLLAGTWLVAFSVLPHTHLGFYINHIVELALVADLFRTAIAGRADDLVEQRRAFRLWLPLQVATQTGGILVFDLITGRVSASGGDDGG